MRNAFGVQKSLELDGVPKGTSVIAQEFRPGKPEPTPIEVIMQQTIDMTQQTLDFQDGEAENSGGKQRDKDTEGGSSGKHEAVEKASSREQLQTLANAFMDTLKKEIENGAIEVDSFGQQLIIRIREKGAFPAGSAFLQPQFRPVIKKIGELVKDIPGIIRITGHTDDMPLESDLYRSKLDLSAQRAVSVAQEMAKVNAFNSSRVRVEGMADSNPRVPNSSAQNRATNRRVDIAIMQGKALESEEITAF